MIRMHESEYMNLYEILMLVKKGHQGLVTCNYLMVLALTKKKECNVEEAWNHHILMRREAFEDHIKVNNYQRDRERCINVPSFSLLLSKAQK